MGLRIAVGEATVWTWTFPAGSSAVHHLALLDGASLHLRLNILTERRARKILGWLNAGAPPEGRFWRSIPLDDIAEIRYSDALSKLEVVRHSGRSRDIASPGDETCREIYAALGEALAPGVRPSVGTISGWRSIDRPATLLVVLAAIGPAAIYFSREDRVGRGRQRFLRELLARIGPFWMALAVLTVAAALLGWIIYRLMHPLRAESIVVPGGRRPVPAP